MIAVVICDGHDKIPASFKSYARDCGFYDEESLIKNGYMSS